MATFLHITGICLLATTAGLQAGVRPAPGQEVKDYSHLWENSPFTSRPAKTVETLADPFADWVLTGLNGEDGGFTVHLAHRKNPGETMVISPARTELRTANEARFLETGDSTAFKIERVELGEIWLDTVVHLSAGGRTGTVRFDEKAAAPVVAPKPPLPQPKVPVPAVTPGKKIPR